MSKNKIKALWQKSLKKAWLARFIAKAIDFFIFALLSCVYFPLGFLLGIIYLAIGDSLYEGESLGKKIIGIRVIQIENGEPCNLKSSLIRNLPIIAPLLLLIIPVLGWILGGALLLTMMAIEVYLLVTLKSGQRLGDMMAETTVVVCGQKPEKKIRKTSWFDSSIAACEN